MTPEPTKIGLVATSVLALCTTGVAWKRNAPTASMNILHNIKQHYLEVFWQNVFLFAIEERRLMETIKNSWVNPRLPKFDWGRLVMEFFLEQARCCNFCNVVNRKPRVTANNF